MRALPLSETNRASRFSSKKAPTPIPLSQFHSRAVLTDGGDSAVAEAKLEIVPKP